MQIDVIKFGWTGRAFSVRIVQLLLCVLVIMMKPEPSESLMSWLFLIPFCLIEVALYRIVDAKVVDSGIEYRHWIKWKHLSWIDIDRAIQNPYTDQIVLKVANRSLLNRFLLLGRPSPSLSKIAKTTPGIQQFEKLISR